MMKFLLGIGGLFAIVFIVMVIMVWRRKKTRKLAPTHPCHCCGAEGWWNTRILGLEALRICTLCEASLSFKMTGLTIREICCTHHGKVLHQVKLEGGA